jgi:pimeloyl-ACP methyl ester carboxylesterase
MEPPEARGLDRAESHSRIFKGGHAVFLEQPDVFAAALTELYMQKVAKLAA